MRWAVAVVLVSIAFCVPTRGQIRTEQLLDTLQHTAFLFFWNEANPTNGLIKDRSHANGGGNAPSSIASVGFGLTAICIGVDRGWVTRSAARDRVLTTLRTFWYSPQGSGSSGYIGHKGFFYHFLDMDSATRTWNSELSSIDTALLFAGILYVREYFDGNDPAEQEIRALADSIYRRADWEWFRNLNPPLLMEWKPETQFGSAQWIGYNEAMIMYILGYGSPTHPITEGPGNAWQAWTSGYSWQTHYGYSYVIFPPLFGHQYSHCWVDFRGIADTYMRQRGIDYFENSRRATLAQRAYCAANPGGFVGYSDTLWGITASDGPEGYRARGAPPAYNDNGTITPTAVIGSLPFAPEAVIPTIHNMWNTYRSQLWSRYGFRDAFNLTQNWWASDVIGIDQGPIIIMIENYRTGKVWQTFMRSPYIRTGLSRIGFSPLTTVELFERVPLAFSLSQNYPNPFSAGGGSAFGGNPGTIIRYSIPVGAIHVEDPAPMSIGAGESSQHVTLKVFNLLGQEVATLVDEVKEPGTHEVRFEGRSLASGVFFY
jgi:hypothetical protein